MLRHMYEALDPMPTEGRTRCWCGSKYWEAHLGGSFTCESCGETYRPEDYVAEGETVPGLDPVS